MERVLKGGPDHLYWPMLCSRCFEAPHYLFYISLITKHFDKTFQNHSKIAYYTPIFRVNFLWKYRTNFMDKLLHSVTQYPLWVTKFIISQKHINSKYFIINFKNGKMMFDCRLIREVLTDLRFKVALSCFIMLKYYQNLKCFRFFLLLHRFVA